MRKLFILAFFFLSVVLWNCTTLGELIWRVKFSNVGTTQGANSSDQPEAKGSYVKVKGDPLAFWQAVMTYDKAVKYQAVGWTTFCNVFLADTIKGQFSVAVYEKIFPQGVKAPNVIYEEWKENPYLVRLDPEKYSLQEVQDLADQGYLVLLSYYYNMGPSHLATVGHKKLSLFTIPSIWNLEGKSGSSLDQGWLPIVVQAGTYTGVTSAAYATNGWFDQVSPYDSGLVRFYLVKD